MRRIGREEGGGNGDGEGEVLRRGVGEDEECAGEDVDADEDDEGEGEKNGGGSRSRAKANPPSELAAAPWRNRGAPRYRRHFDGMREKGASPFFGLVGLLDDDSGGWSARARRVIPNLGRDYIPLERENRLEFFCGFWIFRSFFFYEGEEGDGGKKRWRFGWSRRPGWENQIKRKFKISKFEQVKVKK
ncbi:hypothetical protein TWF696_007004 [Orbilia brochopaga]|uniref:Uncharacterized protein n=1 Tax=Orbilia brochopaga TaxID=3140254 RepID=A0AAV9US12_9PEZI